ncbi:hypothetical protein K437DRAFT_258663 [Tilletiaria anomala UBC 951]|uniref:Uncharacterized protein n=1 Tax=Tilletiaria anomala (strain ATCC 24038 / CBS 436.72 / UBC 951) TaxID=1037660 RepID=A0A066VNV0_TILAU|nr:uncharacterized protein K437DRAFT_258663 [Tilletiaria anomala UBC 951]KDN40439.1 hypothetical protein K437DRAFT_258663 [Tilletiaria anomala UBC 951]
MPWFCRRSTSFSSSPWVCVSLSNDRESMTAGVISNSASSVSKRWNRLQARARSPQSWAPHQACGWHQTTWPCRILHRGDPKADESKAPLEARTEQKFPSWNFRNVSRMVLDKGDQAISEMWAASPRTHRGVQGDVCYALSHGLRDTENT